MVLSACDTAEGDERAALGLAGVAVKAGARSVMASLWSVNDASTAKLVPLFFVNLKNPNLSKAQALQQAQQLLLTDVGYQHPFYWAAFVLIGNWL
jgi:CHAT domain-containing protein